MVGWLRLWLVWMALMLGAAVVVWLIFLPRWEPTPRASFDPPALLQILIDAGRLSPSKTLENRYSDLVDDLLPSDGSSVSFDALLRLASEDELTELERRYGQHVSETLSRRSFFALLLAGSCAVLSVAPLLAFRLIRWIGAGFGASGLTDNK